MCVLDVRRSFESWVGQASKIVFAGYVTERAGGPKEAYFDKPSQQALHDAQMVRSTYAARATRPSACP